MKNTLSFVIPCYKSAATISGVVDEIIQSMNSLENYEYEIILVNDCSPDETYTVIKGIASSMSNVTAINLAKNFGQHAALMAGLRESKGEYVVCLDDDGQTPAGEVYKLIDKLNEGYDVVYAMYENKRHSRFRNIGSSLNSKMADWLLDKPKDIYLSSYFIARKYVIDEITQYVNPYPYVSGLVLRTTNNIGCVAINHRDRQLGKSGYNLKKLISLWINGFTAFSVKPLRIATIVGTCFAFMGFAYTIYALINKINNPDAPMGWTSTIILLLIIGGVLLIELGLIGEYVGRTYISINNHPQYVIKEKIK